MCFLPKERVGRCTPCSFETHPAPKEPTDYDFWIGFVSFPRGAPVRPYSPNLPLSSHRPYQIANEDCVDNFSPCNILYIRYHTSMKITIHTPSDKQIGNVRVSDHVFDKVTGLAKKKKVSNQAIVRAILEGVIDTVEV